MNIKKIIREEIDDFNWIGDEKGVSYGNKYFIQFNPPLESHKDNVEEVERKIRELTGDETFNWYRNGDGYDMSSIEFTPREFEDHPVRSGTYWNPRYHTHEDPWESKRKKNKNFYERQGDYTIIEDGRKLLDIPWDCKDSNFVYKDGEYYSRFGGRRWSKGVEVWEECTGEYIG